MAGVKTRKNSSRRADELHDAVVEVRENGKKMVDELEKARKKPVSSPAINSKMHCFT